MIPDVPYRFTIRPLPADEGGGYLIEFPDLPGCMSDWLVIEEAITNGIDAVRGWIEAMRAEGTRSRSDPLRGGVTRWAVGRGAYHCLACMTIQPCRERFYLILFWYCSDVGSTMADGSSIEWTDATWNPVTGCTKTSRGCDNCYAERLSERFRGVPGHPYATGFDLTLRYERIGQPLVWRRPRMIFVNSMSDLFHKDVPLSFIDQVFDTMERATWHTFQVLTKRSSLMRDYLLRRYGERRGPAHIWCGVSVEDARAKSRVTHMRAAPAGVRFLSIEPLIAPVGPIDLTGIDWVIVGGESGPGARSVQPAWVREVRDQCLRQGVAFFFKQWGGLRPKSGGRLLDGREWNQFPSPQAASSAGHLIPAE